MPDGLEGEMKWAQEEEEFENYVTLLKEARAHFGCYFYETVAFYIGKHKVVLYYMECECKCN